MSEPFIGEVKIWSVGFAPRGWAFCDGGTLPINQYQPLFALLGTTYGGDGRTTFGLPDLRGRVAVHQDQGYALGAVGGETAHVLSQAEMPQPHTHQAQGSTAVGSTNIPQGMVLAVAGLNAYRDPNPAQPLVTGTIPPVGGGAHENMSPYRVLNFCIALVGIFPPRP